MAIMFLNNIDAVINKLEQLQVKSGVVEDLKQLETTSNRIAAIVEDAETMEVDHESTKQFLKELTEVFNNAQDVVDELEYEIVKAQVEKQPADDDDDAYISESCSLTRYTHLSLFANRVKKINETVDEIFKFRSHIRLTYEDGTRRPDCGPKYPLPTTHSVDTSRVFGRKDDKKKIVDWLIRDSSTSNFAVLSIVGKGGIGKTTVAQLVYNDSEVSKFFNLRKWICVPLNSDIVKIINEIVESVLNSGESGNYSQLSGIECNLQYSPKLKKKKVLLLVLDDVWTLQTPLSDSFQLPLDDGKLQLVRIIVTTRNEKVSSITNGTKMHRLDYLPNNQCWELFKSQAFCGQTSEQFAHLEDIAKKIVRKSGGLPLVVKSLGGILRDSTDEELWNDVLKNNLWDLERENEILPILRLSYNYLPTYLKPCFLSCTVFPKDYPLKKVEVVYLWIALGCIQSNSRSLEDVGNEYFDELQKRSFFDLDNKDNYQMTFKMHDCIHDLAQNILDNSCNASSSICFPKSKNTIKLRALVSKSFTNDLQVTLTDNSKHLRFVILNDILMLPEDLHYLYNVRVLVIETYVTKLPDQIVNLINLIYLNVHTMTLTESICQLYNLVTLDLSNSRHRSPLYLPTCFGNLSKLERLYLHACTNTSRITELNNLVNLHGTLCIQNIACLNVEDAKKTNLKCKPKVDDLRFCWNDSHRYCYHGYKHLHLKVCDEYNHYTGKSSTKKRDEDLLESLQPHTNLRSLIIEGYDGAIFPRWLGDPSFTRLTTIQLTGCWKASCLPTLGQLPLLRYLKIERFSNVKYIGNEFFRNLTCDSGLRKDEKVAFPSLLKLEFYYMDKCESWHGLGDHDFPLLQELHFWDCPLIRLPDLLLKKLISFRSSRGMHTKIMGEIKLLKNFVEYPKVLYISGLRNILNAEDAKEANMKIKHRLDVLILDFELKNILNDSEDILYERMLYRWGLCLDMLSHDNNYFPVDEVDNIQADVLESLQPHTNLIALGIYRYGGVSFPHWLGDPSFHKLTKIVISECDNMKLINLPTLGQLPCLESIIIQKMLHIRKIGSEFCRLGSGLNEGDVAFPSLGMLEFCDMPELEEWTGVLHGDFPHLAILVIVSCPSFTTVPTVLSSVPILRYTA